MAASTVIVQHIASVVIFCCAFTAIFQERVSPVSVATWASFCSFLAWLMWDYWMGHEEAEGNKKDGQDEGHELNPDAPAHQPPFVDPNSTLSPRNQQRLATVKSAMLIYAALLGLSPILKSLTRSTTSDSIWAIAAGLLALNVVCFDYSTSNRSQYVMPFIHAHAALGG
jgi:phosphatidylinositol N-acetylglucosaminyltransferase subunit C